MLTGDAAGLNPRYQHCCKEPGGEDAKCKASKLTNPCCCNVQLHFWGGARQATTYIGHQLRRGCTVRIAWIQRRSLNQALAGYQTLIWQVKTCGVTCGLPVIIVGRVLPPKNCLIAKRFHHIWNDLQVRFRIYAPCTLLLLAFPLRYPLSSELLHWYQWIIPVAKVCNSIMIYQN